MGCHLSTLRLSKCSRYGQSGRSPRIAHCAPTATTPMGLSRQRKLPEVEVTERAGKVRLPAPVRVTDARSGSHLGWARGVKAGQPTAAPSVCGPSPASRRQHQASVRPLVSRIACRVLRLRRTNAPTARKARYRTVPETKQCRALLPGRHHCSISSSVICVWPNSVNST